MAEQLEAMGVEATPRAVTMREKQAAFLAALVRSAGLSLAAGIAGTTIGTFRKWRDEDPIFQTLLEMAYEAGSEVLIAEGFRRGVEGVLVTIRDKHGNPIGEERKYSDPILMKLWQGLDYKGRFSPVARSKDPDAVDGWRKQAAEMRDNPDFIRLLEELADLKLGEKSPPSSS